MSVGRGTEFPFQMVGAPGVRGISFGFTPRPRRGAMKPLYSGRRCMGLDLREESLDGFLIEGRVRLEYLEQMLHALGRGAMFFNSFFTKLAGSPYLREALQRGDSAEKIRASWEPSLRCFRLVRQRYLLYPDSPAEQAKFLEILQEETQLLDKSLPDRVACTPIQ